MKVKWNFESNFFTYKIYFCCIGECFSRRLVILYVISIALGICFADVRPGVATFLAVAADGFPIYGPYHAEGEYKPAVLDECNGIEVDGQYRYIATADFPYGPGCFWGKVDDTWNQGYLCWTAKDWLDLVKGTAYYEDCNTTPVPESTGTHGCLSYKNNPDLWKSSFGTIAGWCCSYSNDCGTTEKWYIDCKDVVCNGPKVVSEPGK